MVGVRIAYSARTLSAYGCESEDVCGRGVNVIFVPQEKMEIAMYSLVATIRVEPSVFVFLAFIAKTVDNQCYNPYIFGKIFSRSFRKCMGYSIDC